MFAGRQCCCPTLRTARPTAGLALALLLASVFAAPPARALHISEMIPRFGSMRGGRSFLSVARSQLLKTRHGAELYRAVASSGAVAVWQDSIAEQQRVVGRTSAPTSEDAIVRGDQVLLEDFVIRFDEDQFMRAEVHGWLPGALYAHELGHVRAMLSLGRDAVSFDGRYLRLKGDEQARQRNLLKILSEACREEQLVAGELAPGSERPPCSHAQQIEELRTRLGP